MGGLALRLELEIFGSVDGPSLVRWTPKVSLVVYLLGVGLSIFWFLLLPLMFTFFILVMFSRWFLTLALSFSFAFS